jgi:hypothetical protein
MLPPLLAVVLLVAPFVGVFMEFLSGPCIDQESERCLSSFLFVDLLSISCAAVR